MKILCLGGAGKICRESIYDLIQTSDFEQITIADPNQTEAEIVVEWLDDSRVDFIRIDVSDTQKAIDIMCGYGWNPYLRTTDQQPVLPKLVFPDLA